MFKKTKLLDSKDYFPVVFSYPGWFHLLNLSLWSMSKPCWRIRDCLQGPGHYTPPESHFLPFRHQPPVSLLLYCFFPATDLNLRDYRISALAAVVGWKLYSREHRGGLATATPTHSLFIRLYFCAKTALSKMSTGWKRESNHYIMKVR